MTLVCVEMARVNCIFLDVDSLIEQQLLPTIIQRLLLKQQLEFVLEMHHVFGFEFHSEVQRFGVVDYERISPKIFYQFFCNLIVGHNHEFFHYFFSLYSFLKTYILGQPLFIQLEHHFISVKYITMASCLPPVFGQLLHNFQLLFKQLHLYRRQLFLLHKFSLIHLAINNILSLLIRKLGYTFDHSFLKTGRNDFSIGIDSEENTEGQSLLFAFQSKQINHL